MARIDEQGYIYVLGRKDDMLIRSGMNIYPAEIESVAMQIGGVKSCMVYGEDDIHYGQKICMKAVTDIEYSLLLDYIVKDKNAPSWETMTVTIKPDITYCIYNGERLIKRF